MLQVLRPNGRRRKTALSKAVSAPIKGLNTALPLSSMPQDYAVTLNNWFPQPGYVEVRKGHGYHSWHLGSGANTVSGINTSTDVLTSATHGLENGDLVKIHAETTIPAGLSATRSYYVVNKNTNDFQVSKTSGGTAVDITSAGSGTITVFKQDEPAVESLLPWHGPAASQKMFAAAGGSLWDVTAQQYGVFSTGNGLGSNRWQWVNFGTSAGNFLYIVNGTDAPRYYNGSAWTVPTITGITSSDAVHINVHKRRLWFCLANSTKAAYLPTDAVAGAAVEFDLGSVFSLGGYLVAMTTWTLDGGNGPDDYAVFISSRGQVALYQGTDPSSASTWALVGVFDLAAPIGRRCFVRYGTAPLIITRQGLLKLNLQLKEDKANLTATAITKNIYPSINADTRSYGSNFGWEAVIYPRGTRIVLNVPTAENTTSLQYVQNTLTGAWGTMDNHNANCWAVFNDKLYFGANNGAVYEADTGSTDAGETITATGQCAYHAYDGGRQSLFTMIKALVTATGTNRPQLGISTDFVESQDLTTLPTLVASGSIWDTAKFDTAVWGGDDINASDWATVHGLGIWGSIKFRAQIGSDAGRSIWGVSKWGEAEWGGSGSTSQTMNINGFVVVREPGDHL